jgi:serine/threonine-protein kinase
VIGETIGHFKIVSRLGRGGMGEVYLGEHESIQTRVAIKVLHAEISRDTEHVQRFFNEAKIVGKIKHAGIVKIFDVGFLDDHAYLVMELLEGEPLSARIERTEKLAVSEAADIGRQIASVLDATHRAGVIHRDLKPDNVFLVPDHELASGERVKILDFGISKLSGTMAGNSPKTVGTMGTPAYMAPEQWGDSAAIDWRADAYSLGCVLFEMVCGRPPFVTNTIFEACGKHMHSPPPSPREFTPELPAELDELILRLLAKDPAERAVSMGQIARELEAIATGRELASIPVRRPASHPSADSGPVRSPQVYAKTQTPVPATRPAATLTTLGGSAAELQTVRTSKRNALIGGGVAALAVIAIVVVALTRTNDKAETTAPASQTQTQTPTPTPETQPTPTPTPMPETRPPTPPTPTPTPTPTPPPPTPTPAPAQPPSAAQPHHEQPAHHPASHPVHRDPPAHAGSDATVAHPPPPTPPQAGSDIGGRI